MSSEGVGSEAVEAEVDEPAVRGAKAMWTAGLAIAVGIAVGVVMVLERREVSCTNGTFFPEGETDFRCFPHPQALVGTATIAAFIGLGAVVYLASIVIKLLDSRSEPLK